MTIGEALAIASVLLTAGGLIANQRWQASEIARLEREIEKLRAWHHKIGDNPTERWAQALDVLVRRIERSEKKD